MMPDNVGVTFLPKKRFRKARQWSFLFVDDRGRVVYFSHVKGLVLALLVIVAVCLLAAGLSIKFSMHSAEENNRMAEKLETFRQRIKTLEQENRDLLIKLVRKESTAVEKEEPPAKIITTGKSGQKSTSEITAGKPSPVAPKKPAGQPKKTSAGRSLPTPAVTVDVDNFFMTSDMEKKMLSVRFRLSRVSGKKTAATGYTAVILKDDAANQDNWITLPPGAMTGEDAGEQEMGQAFSISNYKYVKLSAPMTVAPGKLKSATVFVFDAGGALMLEKEFPVTEQ